MSQALAHNIIAEADYLATEERASVRHELVGGEMHAMAGASERHNRIAGNIFFHLRAATRSKTCRAFMADMKLRLGQGALFYYPDAMLVCDPTDDHPHYKQAPCFIAEVLSPATAKIDVREKWSSYQTLPGLRYYLLVDAERLWAKCYSTNATGQWFEQELSAEDRLEIDCGDAHITLTLNDIYEDTGLLL
ncbi:MAG: Uma2 family endonuclease [Reyranella sp.]|uniref:Uma2 family endonuclease n=1 Tax=Reyranella sp. TaxID=1929291 RepID=UPI002731EEF6|nr:Uma2 family endonuclease [Reyranella sp.]MDP1966654.1 Uma2 family endonuclease [Reyranella sp.]MDP2372973.1 Uma2 family endonuclease [Reyranella sp.]